MCVCVCACVSRSVCMRVSLRVGMDAHVVGRLPWSIARDAKPCASAKARACACTCVGEDACGGCASALAGADAPPAKHILRHMAGRCVASVACVGSDCTCAAAQGHRRYARARRREGATGGWGRADKLPDDEIADDSGASAMLYDAYGDHADGRHKGRIKRRPCACQRGRRDPADVATAEVANGACTVQKAVRLIGHSQQKMRAGMKTGKARTTTTAEGVAEPTRVVAGANDHRRRARHIAPARRPRIELSGKSIGQVRIDLHFLARVGVA